ncbi:hypothetical protein F4802DRAFT_566271 [Xylaria palmicola]|nr:hypothetical protein F4802DRAFT_566271 [Xylaria palmicola]
MPDQRPPPAPTMHPTFSTPHGTDSPPMSCDCEAETRRIVGHVSQTSSSLATLALGRASPSALKPTGLQASPSPLADTLKTAHVLVQHWGNVNGCPRAGSHMDASMLCTMTDAIGAVMRGHEEAVERSIPLQRRRRLITTTGPEHNDDAPVTVVMPAAAIGELELEPVEQVIVAQEALKHSILRLAAMLQDIQEETALIRSEQQVGSSLCGKGVNELSTRLFRLLGVVDKLGVESNVTT